MWTDADRKTCRDRGGRYLSDLTDAQWATVAPLLTGYDPLTADLREMVNAGLDLEKTGCPWRYLPTDFGPWETVRTWHDRFQAEGLWSEIAALLTRGPRLSGIVKQPLIPERHRAGMMTCTRLARHLLVRRILEPRGGLVRIPRDMRKLLRKTAKSLKLAKPRSEPNDRTSLCQDHDKSLSAVDDFGFWVADRT
ncbi:transposase [Methylorubrum rhodinum]|uniref:Transposase n=1 Tax=Methylorubrum rhodinum TaxID=29428 RepID=A0A840ZMS1_9HYPH|nr:transposase [Methylorubrum rhodinum]